MSVSFLNIKESRGSVFFFPLQRHTWYSRKKTSCRDTENVSPRSSDINRLHSSLLPYFSFPRAKMFLFRESLRLKFLNLVSSYNVFGGLFFLICFAKIADKAQLSPQFPLEPLHLQKPAFIDEFRCRSGPCTCSPPARREGSC